MNTEYQTRQIISTIFYIVLTVVVISPCAYASTLRIEFETEDIKQELITYMYDNISLPDDTNVEILIYAMSPRSEFYSFNDKKDVIMEIRPAVIKFMVKTKYVGKKEKVKFFELKGNTHEELILRSTASINTYLRSLLK